MLAVNFIKSSIQVVALDCIFSSRIKFVGFKVIFVTYRWWVGPRAVLDILEVIGRVCGRAGRLKKNTFLIKIVGKSL